MDNTKRHAEVLSFLDLKVSKLLGEENIDPHLNLFESGLDSIAIVWLVSQVKSEYGIKILVRDLFIAVCLYEMASLIVTRLARRQ